MYVEFVSGFRPSSESFPSGSSGFSSIITVSLAWTFLSSFWRYAIRIPPASIRGANTTKTPAYVTRTSWRLFFYWRKAKQTCKNSLDMSSASVSWVESIWDTFYKLLPFKRYFSCSFKVALLLWWAHSSMTNLGSYLFQLWRDGYKTLRKLGAII